MKTKPTKAFRILHTATEPNIHGSMALITRHEAGSAIRLAYIEGQSNPKIKKLEWKESIKQDRWDCDVIYGFYIIWFMKGQRNPYRLQEHASVYDGAKMENFFRTLEEAQAFVQSDFEKRIKGCLIIE